MASSEPFSSDPATPVASQRQRVLIIEDNPLNMKLFSAMIEAQGYEVLQAPDGQGGLELAHREHPDLIIMDLQLPGISGLEVTQRLKADDATRDIQIIATSAYVLRGDEEKVMASGVDGFIAKPIAISEFLGLVVTLILRARVTSTLAV